MDTNIDKNDIFKRGKENKNNKGIGFAVFLIVFGGIFLLFNMDIIPIEYKPIFISWQMLLIAIGIWSLFKRNYQASIILIAIGAIFIYPTLCSVFPDYFIYIKIDFKTYWPVILIIVGALLVTSHIFHPKSNHRRRKCEKKHNSKHSVDNSNADFIEKDMVFGHAKQIVLSQNFEGGEVNVVFGEIIVDLRKAKLLEGNAYLELNTVFGNIITYVPSDWVVEVKSSTVFGSFQDKRYNPQQNTLETTSRLLIEGNSVFGNGEIRN